MKLGIMQPYFFPYIGYFQLINAVDEWVFFDIVQYNKKSWMNRNRILHPDKNKEFLYINLPIKKHKKGTLIKDTLINNEINWKKIIKDQMIVYKKLKAPYYDDVMKIIDYIFKENYQFFLDITIESTKEICNYLNINLNYSLASKINFNHNLISEPDDWALEISKKRNANRYINPPGGYDIFNKEKYLKNGIELFFLKPNSYKYKQSWRNNFIANLSIIDVLMFNDKEKIKKMINEDFKLIKK